MRFLRSIPFVLAAALAVGCGGGGTSPTPVTPIASQSSAPTTPSGKQVAVRLTLTIPAGRRASTHTGHHGPRASRTRSYVSEATLGAIVTATSTSTAADNESYGYDLSAEGVCNEPESGPETCTLSIPLYADSYSITIALYDQNETGKSTAPVGNLLSIDTEPETIVVGTVNTLTNFLLHPQVDYFNDDIAASADTFGAVGLTAAPSAGSFAFTAEDADDYEVDFSGNATTYHNAPLPANAVDLGDTTGCSSPCFSAKNDVGTSPGATPATISQQSDESFTLGYTGGGGPGSGVENSVSGAQPSGQRPYAGQLTAVAGLGSVTASVVPLFAYPTSLSVGSAITYVWAAQYTPPGSADQDGTSYSAYFGSPGTTTCSGDTGTIATVGAGTYYAGYGMVFPVTGSASGSCTLTLSDGADPVDLVNVPVTVGTGSTTITIPCPGSPGTPTGSLKKRQRAFMRMVAPAEGAPTLLQSVTGTTSGALPSNVTAGDTLVLIVGAATGFPDRTNNGPVQLSWNAPSQLTTDGDYDIFGFTATVNSTGSIGTITMNDSCNTSFWLGEFAGTSEEAIGQANGSIGQDDTANSSITPSIVPNAANALVITAANSEADTSAATASSGYTEFFQAGPVTSLDVQLATTPTTDTVDPIFNTFSPMAHADESLIFQIPPASFVETSVGRKSGYAGRLNVRP